MQVTTPKSWMALLAFGVLLITALIWSIFGKIPTRVMGRGIFLKSEGLFVVAARGEGNVLELLAQHGDTVTNGQLLAKISQRETQIKLSQAMTNLDGLKVSLQELRANQEQEQLLDTHDFSAEQDMFRRTTGNYSNQIIALEKRTNAEQELRDRELISEVQRLETQNQLYAAQYDLLHAQVQRQELDMAQFQAQSRRRQLLSDREDQVRQAKDQVEYLSNMYTLYTEVRCPYQGEVLEIRVKQGDLITANTVIATLQNATNKLEARLYLTSADGKQLESKFHPYRGKTSSPAGLPSAELKPAEPMEVLLAPVSVKKEEYGLMCGTVEDVSEIPVTPEGMLRVLENPTLVAEFTQMGAPIEVTVRLEEADTPSGFRWTSKPGPDTPITSGTLCEGTITIDHRSPISLVLPFLSRKPKN